MSVVPPTLPEGYRLYVVGDIHGHMDLLAQLNEKLDSDCEHLQGKAIKSFRGVAVQRPGIGAGSGAAARPARRSAITPAR
jgi:hypothetical protein